MDNKDNALRAVFAKNRAEEFGADVWEHFVIPPFLPELNLHQTRKPKVIVGGRGCGKTMLLRYLSHKSAFSPRRPQVPNDAITHVGLYWRVDTQFARIMDSRGIEEDTWISAFDHLLALVLGKEVIQSIESIAESNSTVLRSQDFLGANFKGLSSYNESFRGDINELKSTFEQKLIEFEMWVANVRTCSPPEFLPGRSFILYFIQLLKNMFPSLNEALFFVYVDEYENLLDYQKKLVNTCVKHSEPPLVFNLAMKRDSNFIRETLGEESISDIADFRTYDLEKLLGDDFFLFAAEVLFLNLALLNVQNLPVSTAILRSSERLNERREKSYKDSVLSRAREFFPCVSQKELAEGVFSENALKNKLRKRLKDALSKRDSNESIDNFFRPRYPAATIVVSALLYRNRLSPREILNEFDKLERGEENKFTGRTEWIHNNFIGCLLSLYESHSSTCTFYAGFETFCLLARGNLRHFLELCHKSLGLYQSSLTDGQITIPPALQALAAHQAATAFLGEVRSFGRLGSRLHTFVLWLGSLFLIAHKRPAQSEPEQCHFSITRGNQKLTDKHEAFLREACKWSVLFEEQETKVKSDNSPHNQQYVLNPIYSPYFNISYRKKRRLEISSDNFILLVDGRYDDIKQLLKDYSQKFEVEIQEENQMFLFHLLEESE